MPTSLDALLSLAQGGMYGPLSHVAPGDLQNPNLKALTAESGDPAFRGRSSVPSDYYGASPDDLDGLGDWSPLTVTVRDSPEVAAQKVMARYKIMGMKQASDAAQQAAPLDQLMAEQSYRESNKSDDEKLADLLMQSEGAAGRQMAPRASALHAQQAAEKLQQIREQYGVPAGERAAAAQELASTRAGALEAVQNSKNTGAMAVAQAKGTAMDQIRRTALGLVGRMKTPNALGKPATTWQADDIAALLQALGMNPSASAEDVNLPVDANAQFFGPQQEARPAVPAARGAGASRTNPAIGTTRVINGVPAVWDGTGWAEQR